jgi:hypothetical protein
MAYCPHCLIEFPEPVLSCRVCGGGLEGKEEEHGPAHQEPPEPDRAKLVKLCDCSDLGKALVLQSLLRSQGFYSIVQGGLSERRIIRLMLGRPNPDSRHPFVGFRLMVLESDHSGCLALLEEAASEDPRPS